MKLYFINVRDARVNDVVILPGGLDHWLFFACLLVKALVCLQDLDHARGHGVLGSWVFDVGPQREVSVCAHLCSSSQSTGSLTKMLNQRQTVEVRADVETSSLAGSDGLGQTEQGRSESADAILEQNGSGIHSGTSAGNLDTETVLGDAHTLKLAGVGTGVLNNLVSVVRIVRRGLQEDSALKVLNVQGAEEHTLE